MSRTVLVQHAYIVLTGDPGTADLAYDPQLSRVRINMTGLVDAARYRLERGTDQVRWSTVRGGAALAPAVGAVRVDDYEFAPDVENFYRVQGPSAYDEFARTVAAGNWGTTTSGRTWTGAAQMSVDGSSGVVTHDAAGQSVSATLSGSPSAATAVEFTTRVPVVTTGASIDTGVILRRVDGSNYYLFNLIWATGGTLRLDLLRQVAGVFTTLDSVTLPLTYTGSQSVRLRVEANGTTLRAMAWYAGSTPPSTWAVQATDPSHPAGGVAMRSRRNTGNTNGTTATFWDDFVVAVPEVTVFTASTTPTLDQVWLKSIGRPFLNRPVVVQDYSDISRPSRTGVFEVVGRSFPVAVNDVRGSRRWTLDVLTSTATERQDVDLLLASGDTLLVHVPADCDVPGGYVTVGDTTERRTQRTSARRIFSLPCTETAAPTADVVGITATWQSILNNFATWQDVLDAFPTWGDVLEFVASPEDVIVE